MSHASASSPSSPASCTSTSSTSGMTWSPRGNWLADGTSSQRFFGLDGLDRVVRLRGHVALDVVEIFRVGFILLPLKRYVIHHNLLRNKSHTSLHQDRSFFSIINPVAMAFLIIPHPLPLFCPSIQL
ncbi:hypothetical protein CVT25_006194 [Psilocybe cyanescens]|uniref:Uncharacterized protein n=1 Tax=Psilocybe cyanescens TaxID=93625 RepID=A0A409XH04_PSICY|nr:hypothetical protein CVT25_006194 [Psilocybe cyanescens]